jgi:hypothetical protein
MRKRAGRKLLFFGAIICCAVSCYGTAERSTPCPELSPAADSKFVPGQVWSYQTRDTEPFSTLTILKVESEPKLGTIIHIRVDRIRLHNCSGGPEPNQLEHAPFTREALDRSVVKLLRQDAVLPTMEGYEQWRRDCGGVYAITVAQMLTVDEQTFNAGMGCKG